MSTIFILGVSAGTILSTHSIPYTLLTLNGFFLLIDIFMNSSFIAKYTAMLGVGTYYILTENKSFNRFLNILHISIANQIGINVEEEEQALADADAEARTKKTKPTNTSRANS